MILSELFNIQISGRKLIIDGITYTESKFKKDIKKIFKDKADNESVREFFSKHMVDDSGLEDEASRLFNKTLSEGSTFTSSLSVRPISLDNIEPVIVLDSKYTEDVFMVNTNTNRKSILSYKAWKLMVGDKEAKEYMKNSRSAASIIYDPYSLDAIVTKEDLNGDKYDCLNSFTPPEYMKIENPEPRLHPMFVEFLEHLFPYESDRAFVYDWIHHSLTSRCYTYLCLYSSAQQTGKSTFSDNFMSALHGKENSTPVKDSFPSSQFNGLLQHVPYLHGQEYALRGQYRFQKYETLKSLTSDSTKLENKNVNEFTADLYFSACFTGNVSSPFPLVASEVRFSFPRLTDKRLLDVKGAEWVKELNKLFKEDQVLAEAAAFFKEREPEYDNRKPLLNEKFYEVVKHSAHKFIKFIIGYIKKDNDAPRVSIDHLIKEYKHESNNRVNFPEDNTIQSFFDTYTEEGERIADVVLDDTDLKYYVIPLGQYAKEEPKLYEL